tara:strand:+ start:627 stop:833 length:207 start_codon:yes stop_codon:yes gene_type:complete
MESKIRFYQNLAAQYALNYIMFSTLHSGLEQPISSAKFGKLLILLLESLNYGSTISQNSNNRPYNHYS